MFYLGTASPGTVVDISVGVQVIIAAVLGGRRTIIGGAVGAIVLIVAGEILRPLGQLSTFVVSAVALLAILFVPAGLLGGAAAAAARDRDCCRSTAWSSGSAAWWRSAACRCRSLRARSSG